MAVQAPDRPENKASRTAKTGDNDWLAWIAAFLTDCYWIGLVEFTSEGDNGVLTGSHPARAGVPPAAMLVARKARVSGRTTTVVLPRQNKARAAAESGDRIATEVRKSLMAIPLPGVVRRVVVLHGPGLGTEKQQSTAAVCRWASAWLGRSAPDADQPPRPSQAPQHSLSDTVLKAAFVHQNPDAIARAIVNSTKRLCGCDRVSLAMQPTLTDASSLKLIALSDQASVDVRKVLPVHILATMQEALQARLVQSCESGNPGGGQLLSNVAETTLFREHGEHPVLAIIYAPGIAGSTQRSPCLPLPLTRVVMLLERPAGQLFTDAQTQAINETLEPGLDLLARAYDKQMPLLQKTVQQWYRKTQRRHLIHTVSRHRWKFVLCVLLLASALIPVPHKISAQAAIEARDMQVLIAPQDGFVSTSHVRAGDVVVKGQLLATLETQDLQLAAGKWRSESAKNDQALQQALATKDRVALGRLRADSARIKAESELVERQIIRSELRAPFDGVVLSGDLNQQLGAVVTRGETLFTVAASDQYRLVLELEEQDVGLVSVGQPAEVRLSAFPNSTWEASIDTVLPVATTTAEKHIFRVPANLVERSAALLPGMEGVARLHVGSRSVAWVYTRGLREKVRLLLWRFGIIH